MPLVLIVWLVLSLIWGTTWIAIKFGLQDLPPLGFAATRFSLAALILGAIVVVKEIALPTTWRQWRWFALTGVLQFSINYSLIFWGEQRISSGLAAVLQATLSAFGLVLAWVHLPQERISPSKLVAIALGLVGVIVIFADQLKVESIEAFWASVGVVVGAYAAAHSSVLVKAKGGGLHPVAIVFAQMICGLPLIVAFSLFTEGNPFAYRWTMQATAAVLYLTLFGTVAAFWLYYWLLSKTESTVAMMISVVTPLIAVVIGWWLMDERLPPQTFLGGALIIGSMLLIVWSARAASK